MTTLGHAINGGVRIAYELRGQGPPVVLVHGLGYGRWGWGPSLDGLAARFRALLLDNRGIGDSDAPPGPYSAALMAGDVAAVMDAAGIARAAIVGASLGGMIAQELALARPERVERLVLACTTPGGDGSYPLPERTARMLASGADVPLRTSIENALSPRTATEHPQLVEEVLAARLSHPQPPAGWSAQAAASAGFDVFDRLEAIAAPTLVLHGTDDAVVDHRNAELLALRIPDARVEVFPGAGHLLFWEQPERFVSLVTGFLGKGSK